MARGRRCQMLVAIEILVSILDRPPRFITIRTHSVNWHFAVQLSKLWNKVCCNKLTRKQCYGILDNIMRSSSNEKSK